METRITTLSLMERIPDEPSAWAFMEELRWNGTPVCPHCGNTDKAYFLNPRNGHRTTSTGKATFRRLWKCADCRKPFSVLNDTIMHGSKIPLRTWLMVIFEMASNKNGVAAYEVSRRYGLTNKSAWFLLHRIREAMANDSLAPMLRGTIVADEAFIGGANRNRHNADRLPGITPSDEPTLVEPGKREKRNRGPAYGKVTVLTLINAETGESRSRVVADVTGKTLRKAIAEQVDLPASELWTDELMSYRQVAAEMRGHETVNHSKDEYVRYVGGRTITTNKAENFFSQLKRSIDGTHHHVSRKHLGRYLGEFDFRYSTKNASDTERMLRVVERTAGRRLTYRPLTSPTSGA